MKTKRVVLFSIASIAFGFHVWVMTFGLEWLRSIDASNAYSMGIGVVLIGAIALSFAFTMKNNEDIQNTVTE